ncbi:MAG: dienelactone hydrolase family protein, partial [Pseudomonadota bacterium]
IDRVSERPEADASRIVLAGWSHGAWSIMDLLSYDLDAETPPGLKTVSASALDGVEAVYLTYPFCGFPARTAKRGWARAIPTQVLLAGADETADVGKCREAFAKAEESGADIEIEMFEGVTHAFDEQHHVEGAKARYDAEAAERAFTRFADFLAEQKAGDPDPLD